MTDFINRPTEHIIPFMEAYFRMVREVGEEVSRFASDRMRQNIDTFMSVVHSGNPASPMEMQERWLSKCVRDYTNQSHRMLSIGSHMMQNIGATTAQTAEMERPVAIRQPR